VNSTKSATLSVCLNSTHSAAGLTDLIVSRNGCSRRRSGTMRSLLWCPQATEPTACGQIGPRGGVLAVDPAHASSSGLGRFHGRTFHGGGGTLAHRKRPLPSCGVDTSIDAIASTRAAQLPGLEDRDVEGQRLRHRRPRTRGPSRPSLAQQPVRHRGVCPGRWSRDCRASAVPAGGRQFSHPMTSGWGADQSRRTQGEPAAGEKTDAISTRQSS
jgi:hypothetical protein